MFDSVSWQPLKEDRYEAEYDGLTLVVRKEPWNDGFRFGCYINGRNVGGAARLKTAQKNIVLKGVPLFRRLTKTKSELTAISAAKELKRRR